MAETFSFDEAVGAVPKLVPASRTKLKDALETVVDEFEPITDWANVTPEHVQGRYKSLAERFGMTITSMVRPVINKGAGARSQHPHGTAADFRTRDKKPEEIASFMDAMRKEGFEVIDERNGPEPHIHVELPGKHRRSNMSANEPQVGQPETFSFEEAAKGAPGRPAEVPTPTKAEDKNVGQTLLEGLKTVAEKGSLPATVAAGRSALKRGWEGFQEWMDQETVEVERTDAELEKLYNELNPLDRIGLSLDRFKNNFRTAKVAQTPYMDMELEYRDKLNRGEISADQLPKQFQHLAPPKDLKGFFANLENPLKLLTEDSLPANAVSYLANAPEHERKNFDEARKVTMQENIVANPDKFPAVSVQAAQAAIDARAAKQDPGIREQWNALKTAAKEDPGKFAATFANALLADPYMALAPVGIGAKPIQAVQTARGITAVSRAARIADQILDAGTTAAAINVATGATQNLATEGLVNNQEAKINAGLGYLIGGPLGAVFMKAAQATSKLGTTTKASGALDDILKDMAAAEVAMEEVVNNTGRASNLDMSVRNRIDQMLGIKSNSEREVWLKAWRDQVRRQFKEESDYYDYQAFKAEERMQRAQEIQADREAAAAKAQADAEASRLAQTERRAKLNEEFDRAVAARDAAENADAHTKALRENELWESARKANNEEVLDAMFTKDNNTIKQAMEKARRRDAHLRRPKHARGEIDPRLAVRIGLAGGLAAGGYALSPDEAKMEGSLLGGLLGLTVPGGGRVLSRMRQSGAIDLDGNIISLLVKKGKMVNKLEADELLARDTKWANEAKLGNQEAFRNLYETYTPELTRYVRKILKDEGAKLGIDPEDVMQEAFVKIYNNIGNYDTNLPFGAWARTIARNETLQVLRRAGADKRSALMQVSEEIPGARDSYSGDVGSGSTVYERGAGSDFFDTPETQAIRQESEGLLVKSFEKLPEKVRQVLIMSQLEDFTDVEISKALDMPLGTVQVYIKRGKDAMNASLQSEFKVPKNQRGEVDPKLLKAAALTAAGAATGFAISEDSPLWGLGVGAVAGLALSKVGAQVLQGLDKGLGAASTRVLNHSPKLHRATVNLFRKNLEDIHTNFKKVDPFIGKLKKLPQDVQDQVSRALMTGDGAVIKKFLDYLGDPELIGGYKSLRSALDSLGDQLESLNRFKRGMKEYFPRVVTDKEGLFKAIDKQESSKIADILRDANIESMRKQGRALNQVEESALINQILFVDKRSNQPDWAKNRKIDEITPELQQFYASPEESLHTYIRSAVEDINKAKFFGKHAKNIKKGNQEFIDTDKSIQNLIAEEVKADNLTDEGANEVASVLKSVFADKAPAEIVQSAKNLAYAGLLGNMWSAATQIGDVVMQTYLQGWRPTVESIVRQVTGKKYVDMKDFGLMDSLVAEFATQNKTARYLNKVFKYSLFAGVDQFGKNTALNAAIARARQSVQTEAGQLKFADKYSKAFGDDTPKLISELKSGKFGDLAKEFAFMELSRSQPVTRFEMSQWWLDSPNIGRSAIILKSFMLKQADLARRDGYNLIKQGKTADGILKLTQLGIVLGVAGTTSDLIKQFMTTGVDALLGYESEGIDVNAKDIPLNMLKTFGFSEYVRDRIFGVSKTEAAERRAAGDKTARTVKAEPHKAIPEMFIPPFKIFTDIANKDPAMYRYLIPGFGPYVAEKMKKAEAEEKERARKKAKGGTL